MCSEFGGNPVFNLPGSVCDAFSVKPQDQLDKGSWRALKNSTVNADGGSIFANGEVDRNESSSWVLAHLGMQHGNLIHHRFLEIMKLKLVFVIMSI